MVQSLKLTSFEGVVSSAVRTEGGLFSWEFLEKVAQLQAQHQESAEYDLTSSFTLEEELQRLWRLGCDLWRQRNRSAADHNSTNGWTLTFLQKVLNYTPTEVAADEPLKEEWTPPYYFLCGGKVPFLSAPSTAGLDRSSIEWKRKKYSKSPYSTLQDILYAKNNGQWGLLSDGSELRVVRLSSSLIQKSYISFDLQKIFAEENREAFALLWLVAHVSRLRPQKKFGGSCHLERWLQEMQASGERILDKLHQGVTEALEHLGEGFLRHPDNEQLRQSLQNGTLTTSSFFQELLRLVYRFLFLIAMEERRLLHPYDSREQSRTLYEKGYSLARLKQRAARLESDEHYSDLWKGQQLVFTALGTQGAPPLALTALGGLYHTKQCPHLDACTIDNGALLRALRALYFFEKGGRLKRINYRELGAEEFGSIYEVLLDLTPTLEVNPWRLQLKRTLGKGSERKLSGSYYTPAPLVEQLLSTALDPVIEACQVKPDQSYRNALLSLTIIDPACGSGHFLLAAARRLAAAVADATLQSEDSSYAEMYRSSLREVVRRCIYGVDRNPLAVELCKIALWLETLEPGKPLAFLDAQIQCGDALVGVLDPAIMAEGIPDDAFAPLDGDEKALCTALKKKNRSQRGGTLQGDLFMEGGGLIAPSLQGAEETLDDICAKEASWESWLASQEYQYAKLLADLWTAAFFSPKTAANAELVPLSEDLTRVRKQLPGREECYSHANTLASQCAFFHWHLAYPAIMQRGGFDVVLGNPPWERIKLQEKEFFAKRHPEIAHAKNKAVRGRLIKALMTSDHPADTLLVKNFQLAKRHAECCSLFCRKSGRFPLTGVGDVNTYPLFAELGKTLIHGTGRAGIIVPTGISTDNSTQHFFSHLVEEQLLASLYDFENSQKRWFADVDSRYRFSLLTIAHKSAAAQLAFMVDNPRQLHCTKQKRFFTLSSADFKLFNPNTRTCPLFRSWFDAELAKKIYAKAPVLVDEAKEAEGNPWGVSFLNMFHMSNDSHLFKSKSELEKLGATLDGSIFRNGQQEWLPLLEAKMIHLYDHRWASYNIKGSSCDEIVLRDKMDPSFVVQPRYWVAKKEVDKRLVNRRWNHKWLMGWRDITNADNERTLVMGIFPKCAVGNKIYLLLSTDNTDLICCIYSCLSSLVCDYLSRQKVGGISFNLFIFKQIPCIHPKAFNNTDLSYITPRTLELIYTSEEMRPFAEELGYHGPPFVWNEERRAVLRAELDAYYARLYGLTRNELRYILDPADIYGKDFPSETFRVLKKNEIKLYGEYRTQRLVLEAWDRQERGEDIRQQTMEIGE